MKITIDTSNVQALVKRGKDIFLEPQAEDALLQLLELQDSIDEAIKTAKEELIEAGLKRNPNFSSIRSDRLKIMYRAYGQQYFVDESNLDKLPADFYTKKKKIWYTVNTKAINQQLKETGKLPLGIVEVERTKQISLKPIK